MPHRFRRWLELICLFVGVPTALTLLVPLRAMATVLFPTLLTSMAICLVLLLRDPTFDRRQLWNRTGLRAGLGGVFLRLLCFAPVIAMAVLWLLPDRFLWFPRERTGVWLIVMTFYPLVSVFPQEVIYRAFFFHRYESLFRRPDATASPFSNVFPAIASAAAFGYMHILFRNEWAVLLTFAGGIFFAFGYQRHRSVALAWLDHALWGCFAFTIGLGQYFFLGGIARAAEAG